MVERKGKKNHHFVSAYDKIDKIQEVKIDIEKICFKTKLYSIDSMNRHERESIENFYANTIEKDYNKFYNIITDENIINISPEERELIILTIISLYLRNNYWLNVFNNFWTDLIKRHNFPNPTNVYNEEGEILFPFETQDVDTIILNNKKENKQVFIYDHLKLTLNLVNSHFNDIIFINTDKSETGFITSDKPVICSNIASSFRLPINREFILTIMPNTDNVSYNLKKIVRNCPFINARTFNILQYENAERHLIGYDLKDINQAKEDYLIATK